ncbi:phosphocholine cytidylyltransferase family protein [Saxibacter everestensis]|uniref:Phosphocholine cytidylyltransferase family protein n=1 Tax=Saxibacter everestensis TaxID=2909229 RepID=A0ABY8QTT7_9MICO|nr:phosphocholine cytidylyltransferase family protein [Brevibacteriaceae bacterium ZFBP1038]
MPLQAVILAAGMGTRLARPNPKPLTELNDGRSIMQQQIENLDSGFGEDYRLTIVVGFKLEMIIERFPQASFVYNENYDQTNTSKSLLKALKNSGDGGVLWMNGDVVYDPQILGALKPYIDKDESFISVNTEKVSEEEVKYTVDDEGYIKELSKKVVGGLGEAVGINYVSAKDKKPLIKRLEEVDEQEYFEGGIELIIQHDGAKFAPVDISKYYAVEVDFAEDLDRANTHF